MNKIKKMLWIVLLIGISTQALATSSKDLGTVVGGVAGGIIGSNVGHGSGKTAATIGGAVIGSLVGNQVGHSVDETERFRKPHYPCSHWDSHHHCVDHQRDSNLFLGPDGRLCRHSILTSEFGDRIDATFCCYRVLPNGRCGRWVRVN